MKFFNTHSFTHHKTSYLGVILLFTGLVACTFSCGERQGPKKEATIPNAQQPNGQDGPSGTQNNDAGNNSDSGSNNATNNGDSNTDTNTDNTNTGTSTDTGGGGAGNTTGSDNGTPPPWPLCNRVAKSPDRLRQLIVSFPNTDDIMVAGTSYEQWELDSAGILSRTTNKFTMSTATAGADIEFSPDGELGFVVQKNGTLGVFQMAVNGTVTVLDSAFGEGLFYADKITMHPSGDWLVVVDFNWPNNGGGIYRVDIACDNSLAIPVLLAPAKTARNLAFFPNDSSKSMISARDYNTQIGTPDKLYQLSWQARSPNSFNATDPFPGEDFMPQALALSPLNSNQVAFALIGDNSLFAPGRLAAVRIDNGVTLPVLSTIQLFEYAAPIKFDPSAILFSPWNNAALVLSQQGDDIYRFAFDATNTAAPFTDMGTITYDTLAGNPALPSDAVQITSGPLKGMVFVAEHNGIRRLRFHPDGSVEDLGKVQTGSGFANIIGAIGLQP